MILTNLELLAVIQAARFDKDISPYIDICNGDISILNGIKALLINNINPEDYISGDLKYEIKDIVRYIMITGDINTQSVLENYSSFTLDNITLGELSLIDCGMFYDKFRELHLSDNELYVIKDAYMDNFDMTPILAEVNNISVDKLNAILDAYENNINISKYIKDYSGKQLYWIIKGIKNNLDISVYDNIDYSGKQMKYLYKALLKGIDITPFIINNYSDDLLEYVIECIYNGIDVSKIHLNNYTEEQIHSLLYTLAEGEELKSLLDMEFSEKQAELITDLQRMGINIVDYINPSMDLAYINEVAYGIKNNLEIDVYKDKYKDYKTAILCNLLLKDNIDITELLVDDESKAQNLLLHKLYPNLSTNFNLGVFNSKQLDSIFILIREKLDISWIPNGMHPDDIIILQKYIKNGINLKSLQNKNVPNTYYRLVASYIADGIDIVPYLDSYMSSYQIQLIGDELKKGTNLNVMQKLNK